MTDAEPAPHDDADTDEPDTADDVPDAPVVPVSREGDVWAIGSHRLICGDATDRTVVAALMQGDVAQLCFTSPPYGNQRDYTSGGIVRLGWPDARRVRAICRWPATVRCWSTLA